MAHSCGKNIMFIEISGRCEEKIEKIEKNWRLHSLSLCVFHLGFPISYFNCRITMVLRKYYAKWLDRKWPPTPLIKCWLYFLQILFHSGNSSNFFFHFSSPRCIIDNKNTEPFQVLFVAGLCFMSISIVSSFYLKKISPKILVCKFNRWYIHFIDQFQ